MIKHCQTATNSGHCFSGIAQKSKVVMKWIQLILLLFWSNKLVMSQYLKNEVRDQYFYELIQKNTKNKVISVYYNNNVGDIPLWNLSKYQINNKIILHRDKMDFMFNHTDSSKIINYLNSIDTIYFDNVIKLIEMVKDSKLIAFDYSKPNKIYTNDSIIIPYYVNSVPEEFIIKHPDKKKENVYGMPGENFYKIFLELKTNHKFRLLGFIVYKEYYYGDNFIDLAGINCYILL